MLVEEKDTTYCGWANFPTWCVDMWLSNTETYYRLARHATAARLRSLVLEVLAVEGLLGKPPTGFAADLLDCTGITTLTRIDAVLDTVDWQELEDAFDA